MRLAARIGVAAWVCLIGQVACVLAEASPAEAPCTAPLLVREGEPEYARVGEAAQASLSEGNRAHFLAIPSDPAPAALIRNSHYWISNESSHFVWYEALQGRGGAYLGVGTDQNYLLAGWGRAELLLLVDFDGSIADLHRAYGVAFTTAETPAAFLALWSEEQVAEFKARVVAAYADPGLQARVLKALRIARPLVHKRLKATARRYRGRGLPTFLQDQEQYEHLRWLWREGRVFPIRGDLTGESTLLAVAAALRAAAVPLRVLYLSNAEQYFEYGPSFRRNVLALPFDERSLVVRTLGWSGHGFIAGEKYHYTQQAGLSFAGWMRVSRVKKLGVLLHRKRKTEVRGVSVLEAEPVVSRRPPEIAGE